VGVLVSDFHYHLPEELIAQEPLGDRAASRMLRLDASSGRFEDLRFRKFPELLRPSDLVVFNNTRVFPARLYGRREGIKAQAVSWLGKAAQMGDANAQKALAQLEQENVHCIGRDGISSQLTPVELYKDAASCIDQQKYDDGLFLYSSAGAYGRFDILRVKDATAHGVVGFLPGIFFNQLDKAKVAAFQDRVKQMNSNDALKAEYCMDLGGMSPPAYFPTYMISHGLAATANALGAPLLGNSPGDNPLVSPFDAAKAWKQAVDDYLQCKKPEGTGR